MRGKIPTPTAILKLKGSRVRGRGDEPQPKLGMPDAPECLNDLARSEWLRIVPQLLECGLLAEIDFAMLATYCQAFADWSKATDEIEENGAVVETKNGFPVQSPWVSIKSQAAKIMRGAAQELGLSPASRTRIKVAPKDDKKPGVMRRAR